MKEFPDGSLEIIDRRPMFYLVGFPIIAVPLLTAMRERLSMHGWDGPAALMAGCLAVVVVIAFAIPWQYLRVDPRTQCLHWRIWRSLRSSTRTIPFHQVDTVTIEAHETSGRRSAYRVAVRTSSGSFALTESYNANRARVAATAQRVRAIIQLSRAD